MTQLGTVKVNEGKVLGLWFEIDPLSAPTQISPDSSAPVVEDDKEIDRFTTLSTGEQVTLVTTVEYATQQGGIEFTYVSDNPTEIDVDLYGNVVFQVPPEQTASATITVTGTQGAVSTIREVIVTLSVSGAADIDVITGGVAGSAREALSDVMDNALSGANPSTQQAVFTSQDHVTPAYARNTSFFLNSHVEALTCASPWNSAGGDTRAGTAITKRHVVLAAHYSYGIGTIVRFIAADNSVIDSTVVQAGRIMDGGSNTDAWMVLLDADLPPSITPCKVFPSDYVTYLPAGAAADSYPATALPILALNQDEEGVVLDLLAGSAYAGIASTQMLFGIPTLPDRLAFNKDIRSGDSGDPLFAVIGSELWLAATFFGDSNGPWHGGLVTGLNAMIVTLDTLQGDLTGYTVTEADLSSFTTYP